MRLNQSFVVAAAIAGGLIFQAAAPLMGMTPPSSSAFSLAVAPDASLELQGNSTLHHYKATAHGMEVAIHMDAALVALAPQSSSLEALIRGHSIKGFDLMIPAAKLSSGDHGLDENMAKALKAAQYPEIHFQMDSYDVPTTSSAAVTFPITLHGRLNLAGVERKIDVEVVGVHVREGIRFSGSKDLLMTDYKIKPPTMMFGTIKTADLITMKFTATLEKERAR